MYKIEQLGTAVRKIILGQRGENLANEIQIDVSKWLEKCPDANFSISVIRPDEELPYLAASTLNGNILTWTPDAGDTALPGIGKMEICAVSGDRILKTPVVVTQVYDCLYDDPSDPPEAAQGWLAQLRDTQAYVEQAVDNVSLAEQNTQGYLNESRQISESFHGIEVTEEMPVHPNTDMWVDPSKQKSVKLLEDTDVDATLSILGKAADAAATGEKFKQLQNNTNESFSQLKDDLGGIKDATYILSYTNKAELFNKEIRFKGDNASDVEYIITMENDMAKYYINATGTKSGVLSNITNEYIEYTSDDVLLVDVGGNNGIILSMRIRMFDAEKTVLGDKYPRCPIANGKSDSRNWTGFGLYDGCAYIQIISITIPAGNNVEIKNFRVIPKTELDRGFDNLKDYISLNDAKISAVENSVRDLEQANKEIKDAIDGKLLGDGSVTMDKIVSDMSVQSELQLFDARKITTNKIINDDGTISDSSNANFKITGAMTVDTSRPVYMIELDPTRYTVIRNDIVLATGVLSSANVIDSVLGIRKIPEINVGVGELYLQISSADTTTIVSQRLDAVKASPSPVKVIKSEYVEHLTDTIEKCNEANNRIGQVEENVVGLTAKVEKTTGSYITCWGDSLTAGGVWSQITQINPWEQVIADKTGIPIYSFGVGGEASETICARQGALSIMVNNITIPSASSESVVVGKDFLYTNEGSKVTPLLQGSGGINPCLIGGVEGNLSRDSSGNYLFTRLTDGDAVSIDRPTAIITNALRNYNNGILIIFMGQNDTTGSIDDAIRLHRLMIQTNMATSKKFMVIIRHTGTAESMQTLETAFKREFGRNVVCLREYLSTPIYNEAKEIISCYGLQDAGLEPTEADLQAIAVGSCPPSLLKDSIHFNDTGYTVCGGEIYRKMNELQLFN